MMVTPRFLPEMGGIETHVHEVSRRLTERGHTIDVLTTDRTGRLPTEETLAGVRIKRVPAWPEQRDYYLAPAIYANIMNSACDVLHVQGYHTFVSPLAMFAAVRKRVPFVITFHSGGHSSRLRNILRAPQRQALAPLVRRAAHCIGVSRFEADFFGRKMGLPAARRSVVPNGAQMPKLTASPPPAPETPLIVSIGRLERYKGHHRIIEAFPEILRQIPGARLRVLGEGPYKPHLVATASRLGLQDRISIGGIPPTDRAGVAAVLGSASLVVLLSEYEAHPVAVMEALALGRPVLVTSGSGFEEMVEAGLVAGLPEPATQAQIAASVVQHLRDQPTARTVLLPTWEDCAEQLENIYRGVLR
jgi:glycosyltransferase involved in cell wall biosynthesis